MKYSYASNGNRFLHRRADVKFTFKFKKDTSVNWGELMEDDERTIDSEITFSENSVLDTMNNIVDCMEAMTHTDNTEFDILNKLVKSERKGKGYIATRAYDDIADLVDEAVRIEKDGLLKVGQHCHVDYIRANQYNDETGYVLRLTYE